MSAAAHTGGSSTDSFSPLGLVSVLVSSLPVTLMTDMAPDRYTVEVAFTRRPLRDELNEILSTETARYLARTGYPTVILTVADRRLEIANTHLEELRDGLAHVLASRLADISASVRARDLAAAIRSSEIAEHEVTRANAVARLAGAVAFTPADAFPPPSPEPPASARDR